MLELPAQPRACRSGNSWDHQNIQLYIGNL